MLRGDTVKNDSRSYAVFTEQGSSASQVTAAKVTDIISRLPGCAGQTADAVSAYTQVKMEDAPTLFKNSEVRMSRYLDTSTKTQRPESWSSMEDPVVSLESEICTVILQQDYYWKRRFEKVLLRTWLGQVPTFERLFVNQ